ncbi:phenylalanyl-tRNA synthetase beta chain [Nakamurella flavida]|uniref:phenylalanine--tRNA ligase subunit beta n=1 Tax=Nakamurella flavida TaxID=363630 RepID=UPI0027811224|nr:phenylalanine--tRNA ligase subunit beta [Nakamurella flavida]MDP9777614.1 phenylalanyl-tRNA synthetase beta chain [Nakamurella flavida]
MRAPLEWLSELVDLPAGVSAEEIGEAFVRLGFELEDIHRVPETTGALVVGQVLTITELTEFKKPIRFVTLDVGPGNGPDGSDAPREVICGARNFAAGDKVVVALPGAVLPGGFAIASRQTYGRLSDGMICSVRELGTGTEHDGILVLDADAPVGQDARELLGSHDAVVELAVTPDRGYALSLRGLARELAVAYDTPFTDAALGAGAPAGEGGWPVHLAEDSGCSRFVTVRVTGVDPTRPSPFWMRRRLQQAGVRSISLAVDVTNYVMMQTGQPLHAFDLARLSGDITVRKAHAGETLRTLDGVERRLDPDDVVVTDTSGPISLAGVMGGESTEITDGTTEVLIEAAHWNAPGISRTARRHKLPSEASRRFEREVDPAVAAYAAGLAADLLVRFGGGTVAGSSDERPGGAAVTPAAVTLPLGDPERLIGRPFDPATIALRLGQVGCTVGAPAAGPTGVDAVEVTPPSWRPDLTRPADLVEEVARLEGFDTIPSVLPVAPVGRGLTGRQRRRREVAADLAAAGLTEVLSFPFVGTTELTALGLPDDDVRRRAVQVRNPLDAERPLLRTTLLPGLLDTVQRNLSRGTRDLLVYEIGQVFLPRHNAPTMPTPPADRRPDDATRALLDAALPNQPQHVAVVLAGAVERAGWWGPGRADSWADAVALARRIGETAGVRVRVAAATQAPWHPGRCAVIKVGDWPVGYAGELHPAVVQRLGLPPRTAAVELNLDGIPARAVPVAPHISSFPPVNLDVAVTVSADVPAAAVETALRDGGGELLESVRLFDVYTGDQVARGEQSLAFALVVRAPDRTLTAAQASQVRDAAVQRAAEKVGAVLRG